MEKLDFTVAVAVYNVASYLEECIESIIRQLGDGMELLLVDDGSTDSCGAICDRYAQKDGRIIVIHQKNGGLSAARNTAIECATGEWLIFVDGDDRLPENALSDMKQYSQDMAQMVIFGYVEFNRQGTLNRHLPRGSFVMDTPEALRQYRASALNLQPALADRFTGAECITSWAKMWRLSFIKMHSIRFDTAVRKSEDNAFAFTASRYMNRILVVDRCVYEYRQTSTGIMRRFEPQAPEQYRVLISTIEQDMVIHGETDNPLLMKGLHDLCVDALGFCFMQTLLHTDCRWTRKKSLAWLRELAEYGWVKAAVQGYDHAALKATILLRWMKKGNYRKIDLCCRVLRPFVPLLKRLRLLGQ